MRILTIGNFWKGWDNSICDEEHIAGALEMLGYEVIRWQRDNPEPPIQTGRYDFIIIQQWYGFGEDFVSRLRGMYEETPIIYWAFDHQEFGQEWHERLIAGSDLYLSKRIADSKYPNWHWLAQDFAPLFLDRVNGIEKDIDILFTGSYLSWAKDRIEILRAVDQKYNLVIRSVTEDDWRKAGFKNVLQPMVDQDLPKLYARAKINLSIDHTIEAGYWSDRNAQIMACGGFVLFKYVPLSEVAFHNNVCYFNNVENCLGAIDYFLSCDEDREALADQGYEYAQDNMMVTNRVMDMMTIIKEVLNI